MALDPVNPKALKGKFKDSKDKDIDNDGDTDSSDEYLHKRRQAVSKAINKKVEEAKMTPDQMKIASAKARAYGRRSLDATDYGEYGDDHQIVISPKTHQGKIIKPTGLHTVKKQKREEVDLDEGEDFKKRQSVAGLKKMIDDHDNRAKTTTSPLKKDHHRKMSQQLRDQLADMKEEVEFSEEEIDFINNVMEAMPVAPTSENDSPNPTPKKKAEGSRAKGSMAD